jgi:hypothetical protein
MRDNHEQYNQCRREQQITGKEERGTGVKKHVIVGRFSLEELGRRGQDSEDDEDRPPGLRVQEARERECREGRARDYDSKNVRPRTARHITITSVKVWISFDWDCIANPRYSRLAVLPRSSARQGPGAIVDYSGFYLIDN